MVKSWKAVREGVRGNGKRNTGEDLRSLDEYKEEVGVGPISSPWVGRTGGGEKL